MKLVQLPVLTRPAISVATSPVFISSGGMGTTNLSRRPGKRTALGFTNYSVGWTQPTPCSARLESASVDSSTEHRHRWFGSCTAWRTRQQHRENREHRDGEKMRAQRARRHKHLVGRSYLLSLVASAISGATSYPLRFSRGTPTMPCYAEPRHAPPRDLPLSAKKLTHRGKF